MKTKKKINLKIVLFIITIFIIGWFSNNIYYFLSSLENEGSFFSKDLKSPGNWLEKENIIIKEEGVMIKLKNASWSEFIDTNSMDPVLDTDANAIKIVPENPSDLKIGDIISYESPKGIIIHRIVDKGEDEEGIFFITKGDNNWQNDPEKVRFNKVTGVVVGVLY